MSATHTHTHTHAVVVEFYIVTRRLSSENKLVVKRHEFG